MPNHWIYFEMKAAGIRMRQRQLQEIIDTLEKQYEELLEKHTQLAALDAENIEIPADD